MKHAFKLYEKILDGRLHEVVDIDKMQYGLMPGRETTDTVFVLRRLTEKFRAQNKKLFFIFCKSWCPSRPGSALSPLLFIMVMDVLTDVRLGSLMGLLYADDLVLCGESLDEVIRKWILVVTVVSGLVVILFIVRNTRRGFIVVVLMCLGR